MILKAKRKTKKVIDKDGYVLLWMPEHPIARKNGYVLEHRLVIYNSGVELKKGQVVHHIDGDRANNDISNLEILHSAGVHSVKRHGFSGRKLGDIPWNKGKILSNKKHAVYVRNWKKAKGLL